MFDLLTLVWNNFNRKRAQQQKRSQTTAPRTTTPASGKYLASAAIATGSSVVRSQNASVTLDWKDRTERKEIIIPKTTYPFRILYRDMNFNLWLGGDRPSVQLLSLGVPFIACLNAFSNDFSVMVNYGTSCTVTYYNSAAIALESYYYNGLLNTSRNGYAYWDYFLKGAAVYLTTNRPVFSNPGGVVALRVQRNIWQGQRRPTYVDPYTQIGNCIQDTYQFTSPVEMEPERTGIAHNFQIPNAGYENGFLSQNSNYSIGLSSTFIDPSSQRSSSGNHFYQYQLFSTLDLGDFNGLYLPGYDYFGNYYYTFHKAITVSQNLTRSLNLFYAIEQEPSTLSVSATMNYSLIQSGETYERNYPIPEGELEPIYGADLPFIDINKTNSSINGSLSYTEAPHYESFLNAPGIALFKILAPERVNYTGTLTGTQASTAKQHPQDPSVNSFELYEQGFAIALIVSYTQPPGFTILRSVPEPYFTAYGYSPRPNSGIDSSYLNGYVPSRDGLSGLIARLRYRVDGGEPILAMGTLYGQKTTWDCELNTTVLAECGGVALTQTCVPQYRLLLSSDSETQELPVDSKWRIVGACAEPASGWPQSSDTLDLIAVDNFGILTTTLPTQRSLILDLATHEFAIPLIIPVPPRGGTASTITEIERTERTTITTILNPALNQIVGRKVCVAIHPAEYVGTKVRQYYGTIQSYDYTEEPVSVHEPIATEILADSSFMGYEVAWAGAGQMSDRTITRLRINVEATTDAEFDTFLIVTEGQTSALLYTIDDASSLPSGDSVAIYPGSGDVAARIYVSRTIYYGQDNSAILSYAQTSGKNTVEIWEISTEGAVSKQITARSGHIIRLNQYPQTGDYFLNSVQYYN